MRKLLTGFIVVIATVLLLSACSSGSGKMTIGTLTYTENKILGEMFKALVEDQTDISVEIKHDLATSPIILEGMQNGDIDFAIQYTGTSISSYTDIENPKDSEATLQQAKDFFAGDDFNFKFLDGFGFANTYAFTVRQELADEHGLEKVSDLVDIAPDFNAAFDTAWLERENDGYPAFQETYDIEFGNTNPMEIGLVYDAVKNDEVDIVLAYSTDPRIVAFDLKILEDDKNFFPPYDAAPAFRQEILDEHPELEEIIEPLLGSIDEELMATLSGKVDLDGEDIKDVAIEYLKEQNLLE